MTSTLELKHLERWTLPSYYMGARWDGFYVGLGQNRDSSALDRANFDAFKAALDTLPEMDIDLGAPGPDNGDPTIQVIRESHWACGWIEWIAIHETNTAALELADKLLGKIEDYPVLDEELWSQYEDTECAETWANCYGAKERLEYFRQHSYTCTDVLDLLKAIKGGDWYHAANMLHCPSDLIA